MARRGTIRLGSTTVDLDGHVVRRPGAEEPLTAQEVAVLAYLAERRGETVSRARLLEEVWGYAARARTRAADHAVSRIRRKVEPDPSNPRWLLSVRGAGYRLAAGDEAPAHPRHFYGREAELAQLAQGGRLRTVWGPPGVGKSRLVREFLREEPGDRRAFVALQPARDAREAGDAVLEALGLRSTTPHAPWDYIGRVLAGRPGFLVVLDNAEHLVDEIASAVSTWLDAAPALRIVVTSRHPLGLEEEEPVALRPLSREASLAVMLARARQVCGTLEPTAEERGQLATLATEVLDGLPLALELAAARLAVLSVAELGDRLAERFRVLSGATDTPWTSLEAALDWSWELLSETEQSALTQCAVFSGGFSLAMAEAVLDLGPASVDETLGALVRHSLVGVRRDGATPRFELLQSVHDFARARGTADRAVLARLRDWCVEALVPLGDELRGHGGAAAALTIQSELPNLWAATESALDDADADAAAALCWCLCQYRQRHGERHRRRDILERTLELIGPEHEAWVRLTCEVAGHLNQTGDPEEALRLVRDRSQPARGPADVARLQHLQALSQLALGQPDAARELAAEAVAAARRGGDDLILGAALYGLSSAAAMLRPEEGVAHAREALDVARATGDVIQQIACLHAIAVAEGRRRQVGRALDALDAALRLAQAAPVPWFVPTVQVGRAFNLLQRGDVADAMDAAQAAADAAALQGGLAPMAQARQLLITMLVQAGRLDEAAAQLELLEAVGVPAQLDGEIEFFRGLVHMLQGDDGDAARWLDGLLERPAQGHYQRLTQASAAVARMALHLRRDEIAAALAVEQRLGASASGPSAPNVESVLAIARALGLAAQERRLRREADALARERAAVLGDLADLHARPALLLRVFGPGDQVD